MNNRRKFISVTGLAITGFAIEGLPAQTLAGPRAGAEQDVFDVISKYGSHQKIARGAGTGNTVSIQVRMRSHEAFANTFLDRKDLPFETIHAAGNTLRFQHKGIEFLLEHLV